MNTMDACMLLEALLDGVNPITGEMLPEDHVCQEPDVLRALHRAVTALRRSESAPAAPEWPVNRNGRLNAGRPWTREDLNQLRQLHEDGVSMEEMCNILQRRSRGVEKHLLYLGLTDPPGKGTAAKQKHPRAGTPWTADDDKTLHALWKQGEETKKIAQILERSVYAIECRMERLGMLKPDGPQEPPLLPPWSMEEVMRLKEMHARGCTVEEIAEAIRYPVNSVRARMFYMGLTREAPFHL